VLIGVVGVVTAKKLVEVVVGVVIIAKVEEGVVKK
jgi:hypothetical protein